MCSIDYICRNIYFSIEPWPQLQCNNCPPPLCPRATAFRRWQRCCHMRQPATASPPAITPSVDSSRAMPSLKPTPARTSARLACLSGHLQGIGICGEPFGQRNEPRVLERRAVGQCRRADTTQRRRLEVGPVLPVLRFELQAIVGPAALDGGQHAPLQLRISAHRGRHFSVIVDDGGDAQVISWPGLRLTAFCGPSRGQPTESRCAESERHCACTCRPG